MAGRRTRLELIEHPEPFLDGGERLRAAILCRSLGSRIERLTRRPSPPFDLLRQQAHGGSLEKGAQRKVDAAQLADSGNHLSRQQRMSSEIEEVVAGSHTLEAEAVRPDIRQELFEGVAGNRRLTGLPRALRRRQGLAVDLAVGGERQRFEHDIKRRHHVIRQALQELCLQLGGTGRPPFRVSDEIGHQTPPLLLAAHHHDSLRDRRLTAQSGLDLAQLDAETADLHLMVDAAQELDLLPLPPAHQVARPVEPRATLAGERFGHEPLGGQDRLAQVAAGQPGAGDAQLPRRSGRHWRKIGVEHVEMGVGDRPSQTDRRAVR